MASLSHSPLPDYPNKRICKEATTSLYPSSNNMQDLYALMQTLHPHLQAPPYMNAKPFYYSSNVQGMSKVNGEEELGSSLTTNTCSTTSWRSDQAASLHEQKLMEAMERKPLISTSNHVAGEHHVNAAKKRIRAMMDHKDAEKDVEANGGMKRTKSTGSGDVNAQKKELPMEVKPTNSNAQKARGSIFNNTEPKSSDVKSSGKAYASPTSELDSPSKPDFIHVRARRGQATDSHSLAERVRREKISERMKYLQDLVPGCVKVTGKAMMLDEIINYVQALQRQVEFLSMKLAAVHPSKLEFSLDNLFGKKVVQPNNVKDGSTLGSGAAVPAFAPLLDYQGNVSSGYATRGNEMFCDSMQLHEVDASMLQTASQLPCNPAEFLANLDSDLGVDDDALMHRTAAANSSCSLTPPATDAMLEPAYHSCISQNSQSELDWDDDLQNIVQQMGCFSQTSSLFPHVLSEGLFLQSHMKTEEL